MFGNSKRAPVFSDQVETLIGQETQVKGTVNAGGTLRVDGQVEGEITAKGDVVIGETGNVKAQIRARSATIAGSVYGNVEVTDKLELAPTGKLYGDIKTGVLIIGEGAVFKGACEMRHGEKPGEWDNKSKDGKANPVKS